MPRITVTVGDRTYRYLWLKYVTGIDLGRHCAAALHGRYSHHITEHTRHVDIELDEFPHTLAWYLCGVTSDPHRWEDNPHLALEAAPGHTQELQVHDLTVHLDGIRPIPFTDADVPADSPHADDRAYSTCRNWWFAHHLHHVRGVPNVPGDRPRIRRPRPGTGQGTLLPKPPGPATTKGKEADASGGRRQQAGPAGRPSPPGAAEEAPSAEGPQQLPADLFTHRPVD
ncbi:hypothetical protein OG196_14595 [Kitasatospora purpeofusca]|uniref:hypothetical protein n=1 Tax=Kitasatospora purpeofusca TaxID=67352 RepID=UPI002E0F2454|nr:hypothetical protein OG196_14595 [Kitasatospora purpeofusca]